MQVYLSMMTIVFAVKMQRSTISSHSCLADRELDEALWESGSRQVLAAQRDPKTLMQGAAASAPVKRRALEQVGISCWGKFIAVVAQ